jgi:hypothetical protein
MSLLMLGGVPNQDIVLSEANLTKGFPSGEESPPMSELLRDPEQRIKGSVTYVFEVDIFS